jgi:serine O-acetyltransferase
MWQTLKEDIQAVFDRDPAARSVWEVVFAYPGFHAILIYRLAHWLWARGLTTLGRVVSHIGRFLTGIEIHPGAKIGRRCFIDHGMGVVIGETTEIGDDVTIYQGVTLGGTSTQRVKRHPTIEDSVTIFSGAAVLGPVVIGRHSRVGAGSVVVTSVPHHSTVVGIPGRVVKTEARHTPAGKAIIDLNSADLPDPLAKAIGSLIDYVQALEKRIDELSERQGGLEMKTAEESEVLNKVRELLKNTGS